MRYIIILSILSQFLVAFTYKATFGCITLANKEYVAIRYLNKINNNYYLVVDKSSLKSGFIEANEPLFKCDTLGRYGELLDTSTKVPYPLQNDGVVSSSSGVIISTDLCPSSKKGFEDRLYKALIAKFKNPVPVTLFITKRWIVRHKKELLQFINWQKSGKLNITWGNHTAYHRYNKKVPLNRNFVLLEDENLEKDILDLEIELINNGITPSIFFRFPGLVSDKKSIEKVKKLGLITIGSNTWVAKNQSIKEGSIILLHGNKNEPQGVDIFLKNIENNRTFFDLIDKNLNSIENL